MTSAVSGDVKGTLANGKWAHRAPLPDEVEARQVLAPWFANAVNDKGERIPLSAYIKRLKELRKNGEQ